MYRLYAIPGSCSTGIHVLLNKLGVEFELVNRDAVANYQELVPTNQVPALRVGDDLLTEGAAIVMYLLEEHGMAPLPGQETREFRQWLLFNYATLHATYSKLFLVGAHGAAEDDYTRQQQIDGVAERISTLWDIVEARLSDRDVMVGDTPTIIDYLLAVYANWGNSFPTAKIRIGAKTRHLIQEVVARREFQAALQREQIDHHLPEVA
jgi:glutathione S-transferase